MLNRLVSWIVGIGIVLLAGCALTMDPTPPVDSGLDAGRDGSARDTGGGDAAPVDSAAGNDTGRSDAAPATDAGSDASSMGNDAGRDAALTPVDSGSDTGRDGGLACAMGVECTNFAAALAASARGAAGGTPDAALANCVIQMHRLDCCGAQAAYGINHGSRTTLCPAECSCDAMYTVPATCSSNTITTDTGATTSNMSLVRIRVVNPTSCSFGTCYTCQTFVCAAGDPTCASAPGIAGGCGPCS